jgi:RecA-family ATPase
MEAYNSWGANGATNADSFLKAELISASEMLLKSYPGEHYIIGPKLLPKGGKMLLTAEAGTGKSAIAMHIAACLATGTPLFGLTRRKKDANFGKPVFLVSKPYRVL